jgi:hypothetical protein
VLIRRARPGDIEPALAVMAEGFGLPIKAPSVHTEVADQLLVAEDGSAASWWRHPRGVADSAAS